MELVNPGAPGPSASWEPQGHAARSLPLPRVLPRDPRRFDSGEAIQLVLPSLIRPHNPIRPARAQAAAAPGPDAGPQQQQQQQQQQPQPQAQPRAGSWDREADLALRYSRLYGDARGQECAICWDLKSIREFPPYDVTSDCTHRPRSCTDCLREHIQSELRNKMWNPHVVRCPECNARMRYRDIQGHADPLSLAIHTTQLVNLTQSILPGFTFTCSCGSEQLHMDFEDDFAFMCVGCRDRFCRTCRVPEHPGLTCQERRELMRYTAHHLTRLERSNVARRHAAAATLERRRQEMVKAGRARPGTPEQGEGELEAGEQESRLTLAQTTKRCPCCNIPIEKIDGCHHMKCLRCTMEFWWCCLKPYEEDLEHEPCEQEPFNV